MSESRAAKFRTSRPFRRQFEAEEDQTEERLRFNREGIMDGNCPEKNTPERVAIMVQTIEKLVDQASLQPELEAVLAALRVSKLRERQEEESLRRYRVGHLDHLVMPSVKRLEIFGRWIMSDEVLEILLGRVFRNLKELSECLTEGYSLDTLIRVTQSMPWLETVQSVNPVDLTSLRDEHKLQLHTYSSNIRFPFTDDSKTRVRYQFLGHQNYILAANGGSEAQEGQVAAEE
ncbi:hypothetical protein BG003_006299 [Podila horticola]|nr:hypothetical protein BG003_006299 [Podila horticola]